MHSNQMIYSIIRLVVRLDNNVNLKKKKKLFLEVFEVVLPWCVLYPHTALPYPSEVGQSA